jgi:hypothetical protein
MMEHYFILLIVIKPNVLPFDVNIQKNCKFVKVFDFISIRNISSQNLKTLYGFKGCVLSTMWQDLILRTKYIVCSNNAIYC